LIISPWCTARFQPDAEWLSRILSGVPARGDLKITTEGDQQRTTAQISRKAANPLPLHPDAAAHYIFMLQRIISVQKK
jgi:hypothetical protein